MIGYKAEVSWYGKKTNRFYYQARTEWELLLYQKDSRRQKDPPTKQHPLARNLCQQNNAWQRVEHRCARQESFLEATCTELALKLPGYLPVFCPHV